MKLSFPCYFFSQAINNVDLITLKSFGAFAVDSSPPLAGHVFDGDLALESANHRDQDFQEDRTAIKAFWEGFHDPHSAIVGYSWKAGVCRGCGDVVPSQLVGLDTGWSQHCQICSHFSSFCCHSNVFMLINVSET